MSESSGPSESLAAATKAIDHHIRRDLIRTLKGSYWPVSAPELARGEGVPLSRVSYHASLLVHLGVTERVEGVGRDPATRCFYMFGGPNSETAVRMLDGGEGSP